MGEMPLLNKLQVLRPPKEVDACWNHCLPVAARERIFGFLVHERDTCPTSISFTREVLQPTLRAAALVCKAWYEVATKYLYQEIYLTSTRAVELLANALSKYERLRPLVYHFHYTGKAFKYDDCVSPYGLMDLYNHGRIHKLCPNLMRYIHEGHSMFHKYRFPRDNDDAFRMLKLDRADVSRLTYMSLVVPGVSVFGGQIMFSPSMEFPALESLWLSGTFRSYPNTNESDIPQWFRVPQLRRLTLFYYNPRKSQVLTFPDSPHLHTIELVRGNYHNVENLFDPKTSPLLPFRKSLQSLTVNVQQLGKCEAQEHYYSSQFSEIARFLERFRDKPPAWSLGFLENLTELCLPFKSFATADILSYPPQLKDFLLVGYSIDRYIEPPEMILGARDNMKKMFSKIRNGSGPRKLKRLQVRVDNIDTYSFRAEIDAHLTGMDVKLGLHKDRTNSVLSEAIDIGLKKVHLK